MTNTDTISKSVQTLAKEYAIKKVDLFGSYALGNQTESSDVDLLVEFEMPNISLFTISSFRIQMEEMIGTQVDIIHAPVPEDSLIDTGNTVLIYEA